MYNEHPISYLSNNERFKTKREHSPKKLWTKKLCACIGCSFDFYQTVFTAVFYVSFIPFYSFTFYSTHAFKRSSVVALQLYTHTHVHTRHRRENSQNQTQSFKCNTNVKLLSVRERSWWSTDAKLASVHLRSLLRLDARLPFPFFRGERYKVGP